MHLFGGNERERSGLTVPGHRLLSGHLAGWLSEYALWSQWDFLDFEIGNWRSLVLLMAWSVLTM